MKALVLAIALLLAVPASANAFCFKEIGGAFHKPKVETQVVGVPYPGPVQIRPAGSQVKPDSFCKTVARSAGITLVVQGIMVVAKVGLAVATGILIL